MEDGISVCFVIKNGIINGYPFWESLTSCLGFADEIIISEGYSRDNTLAYVKKFALDNKNINIKIFNTDWNKFKFAHGETISAVSSEAMLKCTKKWIYYLQADEIIHENNYEYIKDIVKGKFGNVNSVKFPFYHFIGSWEPLPKNSPAYNCAIRMVRNIKSISLLGDAWTFQGGVEPTLSEDLSPKPIYHLAWVFPKNIDQKNLEQAKIYSGIQAYKDKAQKSEENIKNGYKEQIGLKKSETFFDYPKGIDHLIGRFEYTPPVQI